MAEINEKVTSTAVEQVQSDEKQHHAVKTEEHKTFLQAFKESPWAVIYCLYPLFTCIMW